MRAPLRHLPAPRALLSGVLYLVLLAALYLADWLASLRGDETRWLAPLTVAALAAVALALAGPFRPHLRSRRHRRDIPVPRRPQD